MKLHLQAATLMLLLHGCASESADPQPKDGEQTDEPSGGRGNGATASDAGDSRGDDADDDDGPTSSTDDAEGDESDQTDDESPREVVDAGRGGASGNEDEPPTRDASPAADGGPRTIAEDRGIEAGAPGSGAFPEDPFSDDFTGSDSFAQPDLSGGFGSIAVTPGTSIRLPPQPYEVKVKPGLLGCELHVDETDATRVISGGGDVYVGEVLVSSINGCVVDSVPPAF